MIVVMKVTKTCEAMPAQWEGTTEDGQVVYARYRHGHLRVGLGKTLREAVCAGGNAFPITQIGGTYHGEMSFDTLKQLTQEVIRWPATEELRELGDKRE